ncbi:hypothetical protein C8R47DRAFT_970067 [Mycena vitilis]|nr:hypothetical protein C8R47DRAFT_970067 [Mycena vitilis]
MSLQPPPSSAAAKLLGLDSNNSTGSVTATEPPPESVAPSRDVSVGDGGIPPLSPADKNTWLGEVYGEVSAENLGGEYNAVLGVWAGLERAYGYERKTGKPPAWNAKGANRPSAIDKWVGVGRGRGGKGTLGNGAGPPIDDVKAFDAGWWRWWAGFQPGWRVKNSQRGESFLREKYPEPTETNWGPMRFPGPNGALNFVATLYWWGRALTAKGTLGESESWAEAVEEVKWMLTVLLAFEQGARDGGT